MSERRALIDSRNRLPVTRQCRLLNLNRSSVYYRAQGVSVADLELMRRIDAIHLEYPFYGSRRVRDALGDRGHYVNRKRVQRQMGLAALYPKPRTSVPGTGHTIYPYRLTGLTIDRPNQIWTADLCYIPMAKGFMYLMAIMDWHTRKVLAWRVSNTMDTNFCVAALEEALRRFGCPEIFNTDQGVQFTSEAFTSVLKCHEITISMDGKGRWMDNVFVERLWRTVKYEDIYLKAYETPRDLQQGLEAYFRFYNTQRRHTALGRQTPDAVYSGEMNMPQAA